ncbi:MAG: O-methyltransferase [Actinomycetota bacterium]
MKRLETDELWTAIDNYIGDHLIGKDAALDAALAASVAAGLPPINVAPNQGKLLMMLAQMIGAKRILEIGMLGGYSTIWLARGLAPGGRLITLELDPRCAEVARSNLDRAVLGDVVEIRVGKALDTLPSLAAEAPFDLIFIDADKPRTPDYFTWAMKLSRPGSLIVVDNVVREGAILDADSEDPHIRGTRRFYELAAAEPRVSGTALQTTGSKGHDGIAILRVIAAS